MTTKRIAVLSSAHPWTDSRVHIREAASLAEDAHNDVHLLAVATAEPDFPSTNVTLHTIPARPRFRRMAISSAQVVWKALRLRPQVAHLHDPELIWAIPLLQRAGISVVYDAHEDLPDQVANKPWLPHESKVAQAVARACVRVAGSSDAVIAATEKIAQSFPRDRTEVIKNYPIIRPQDESASSATDRGLRAVYIGALNEVRGGHVLSDLLRPGVLPDGWSFDLAGAMSASMAHRICEGADPKLNFLGTLTKTQARDLLLGARVGLVLFGDTAAHREALPTKFFEYMAAGVPVIASDFPLWRGILEEFDCGITVDQTDPCAVAQAIAQYSDDELFRRQSQNARLAVAEKLNWAPEAAKLHRLYERLPNRDRRRR